MLNFSPSFRPAPAAAAAARLACVAIRHSPSRAIDCSRLQIGGGGCLMKRMKLFEDESRIGLLACARGVVGLAAVRRAPCFSRIGHRQPKLDRLHSIRSPVVSVETSANAHCAIKPQTNKQTRQADKLESEPGAELARDARNCLTLGERNHLIGFSLPAPVCVRPSLFFFVPTTCYSL